MTPRDRILNFQRFALTNTNTIINEDSMTITELNIRCNQKMKECLEVVDALTQVVLGIADKFDQAYDEGAEELTLTIAERVEEVKKQLDGSYRHIVDEDSMDAMEQAGRQMCAINECIKSINMMCDLVKDLDNRMTYIEQSEMLVISGGDE